MRIMINPKLILHNLKHDRGGCEDKLKCVCVCVCVCVDNTDQNVIRTQSIPGLCASL